MANGNYNIAIDLEYYGTPLPDFYFSSTTGAPENNIEDERRAYEYMRDNLEQQYSGQYVAIYYGKLIDSDIDRSALLHRFYKNYGNKVVYIKKVGETDRIYKVLTPFSR